MKQDLVRSTKQPFGQNKTKQNNTAQMLDNHVNTISATYCSISKVQCVYISNCYKPS